MRLPTYQDLSKEQDEINNLPLEGRYLVTGPPGSGKTVMAIYRARTVSDAGDQVRLLMYNKLLAQYTRAAVGELGIDGAVTTFHSWLNAWCRSTWQKNTPQIAPYCPDWTAIVKLAVDRPPTKASMPHLMVDEAQDMPPMFFAFARHVAKELTVFADENQRITDQNSTLAEIRERVRPDRELHLRRNYRNTHEIAVVARHFHRGVETGVPDLPDRHGPRPVLTAHPRTYEAVMQIVDYATTFSHQQIGVLVPNTTVLTKYLNRMASQLPGTMSLQYYRAGEERLELEFVGPGMSLLNWASAKGLEFDVVFLPELQAVNRDHSDPTFMMQLYVLCSRARERLFFSYTGEGRPAILDLLPLDELEVIS